MSTTQAYQDLPLSSSPLSHDEAVKIETLLDPLLRYLGSPGDWGYETKLGLMTLELKRLRSEIRSQASNEG